jgi:transposase
LSGRSRELYADAAYDTENIRRCLESMGIEPNIPVNPRNGRRPGPYNLELYRRMRSAVERFFGWLKSFRRIVIRYERLAITYRAIHKHSMHNNTLFALNPFCVGVYRFSPSVDAW